MLSNDGRGICQTKPDTGPLKPRLKIEKYIYIIFIYYIYYIIFIWYKKMSEKYKIRHRAFSEGLWYSRKYQNPHSSANFCLTVLIAKHFGLVLPRLALIGTFAPFSPVWPHFTPFGLRPVSFNWPMWPNLAPPGPNF